MKPEVKRMRVDAPERYRSEIEEARRLAERRGFDTDVDECNGDARLTVSGGGNPEDYAGFAAEMSLSGFALDVHVSRDPGRGTGCMDRLFVEHGLFGEFWAG